MQNELVEGIFVGHATNAEAGTGCTVIVAPDGATGAIDVRGGAPATRESDLLRPEETVQSVHAVVLSGGSAFGLAASSGVANYLETQHIGVDVGITKVPIVVSACLFDLAVGDSHVRPDEDMGIEATKAALAKDILSQGCVGAGTGASAGKLLGPLRAMKSGLGISAHDQGDLQFAAVAALNPVGSVVDPQSGEVIAGALAQDKSHILGVAETLQESSATVEFLRQNTTISCVMTNARLTKAEATKVAQMCADAYAHTIYPTHTTNDGDTIFVLATNKVIAPSIDLVGIQLTQALEAAIVNGARFATSSYGLLAHTDLVQ